MRDPANEFVKPSGKCVYQENTSGIFHGITQESILNYFIPYNRKYSGQHNQCDIRMVHNGKV